MSTSIELIKELDIVTFIGDERVNYKYNNNELQLQVTVSMISVHGRLITQIHITKNIILLYTINADEHAIANDGSISIVSIIKKMNTFIIAFGEKYIRYILNV